MKNQINISINESESTMTNRDMNANIKTYLETRGDGISIAAKDRINELEAAICSIVNNDSEILTPAKKEKLKTLVLNRSEIKE